MGSEIERKYIMEEWNYFMGSEITLWGTKMHHGAKLSEIERKYIMEEWNYIIGSEITLWVVKIHHEGAKLHYG